MSLDNTYKALLQKLVAGTITDKERWTLQKASLDDPFLADALEGYAVQKTEEDDLVALRHKINGDNKTTPVRRLVWRRLSIAATLLALFSVSFWMFQQNDAHSTISAENTAQKVQEHSMPQSEDLQDVAYDQDLSSSSAKKSKKESVLLNQEEEQEEYRSEASEQETEKSWTEKRADRKISDDDLSAPSSPPPPVVAQKKEAIKETVAEEKVVFTKTQEESILEEDTRSGNAYKRTTTTNSPAFKKKSKSYGQSPVINETKSVTDEDTEVMDEIVVMDMPSAVSQSNAGPIERLPQIIKGKITGANGEPLQGVDILDIERNKIARSDAEGHFVLPDMNGYVVTAFAGYDSTTVAITPQLSIALQPSSKLLSQPLKRAVDMMDDNQLGLKYTNDLNRLFSQNWPLCERQQAANDPFSNIRSTTIIISVDDLGGIFDLTYMSELSQECKSSIDQVLEEALDKNIFANARPISFRYRINL